MKWTDKIFAIDRISVVVTRDNMPNALYLQAFNLEDAHPTWQGFMELLHRMEGALLDDPEKTPEAKVAALQTLKEIRAQMGRNRAAAQRAIADVQRK